MRVDVLSFVRRLVGYVAVRADDTVEQGTVHARTALVPAPPVEVDTVLVTPLDEAGAPLAGTVALTIAGRS